ncbi:sensor histidine kinase [Leptospira sp. GIMC2001]|uniref:sensor histidine kinase n=1 Tax=Leptospira sp. GIMC2001 TaxID=1513297 RepID=UPI00234C0218|nr:HAMP domain-containing sensor histidine kinase [Leptospira sp. GIMC2001]WCL50876.1 HAMP domain-containing sensor histidine kinase [Leptospira sp. GIMC2001]
MDRKINRIYLSVFWLILSFSLGAWWFNLALRQIDLISELTSALGEPYKSLGANLISKQSRMIWMEGTFFLGLLTIGGSFLVWLSYRDLERNKMINDFFSTVTHEMNTPLAGLRLQVEGLLADLGSKSKHSQVLIRALKESDRIESQMEKAFYLASLMRSESLFIEPTKASDIKEFLSENYPSVSWNILSDEPIRTDKRAIESILKNLIENSYKHGKATSVEIKFTNSEKNQIKIEIQDNGSGFEGSWQNLGKPFIRHSNTSGSGVGIYIIKQLLDKMNGRIQFFSNENGFKASILLPKCVNKNEN